MRFIPIIMVLVMMGLVGCGGTFNVNSGGIPDVVTGQDIPSDVTPDTGSTDDGFCSPGTVKCDGKKVYKCATGGLWLFLNECQGKETCVVEEAGCACVPDCDGAHCGEDGCGALCTCPEQHVCAGVTCVCVPDCQEGKCGPNGCGGNCDCPGNETCVEGICKCIPDCVGRECGTDGCGGSCGQCPPELLCSFEGQCTDECIPEGTGTTVGHHAKNLQWMDSEGESFELHSQCQSKKIVVLMQTAGW